MRLKRKISKGIVDCEAARKSVADKTFVMHRGVWIDTVYEVKLRKDMVTVQYLSDRYFALMDEVKGITKYLSVGEQAIIVVQGKAYRILLELPTDEGDVKPGEDGTDEKPADEKPADSDGDKSDD